MTAVVTNPLGVNPGPPSKAYVYNRSGAARAVGDALMLNFLQTGAETTGFEFSSSDSVWSNAVLPATALLGYGVFCVVSDLIGNAGADDALLEVTIVDAAIDCNVIGVNLAAPGDPVTPENGVDTFTTDIQADGSKITGIALEATADGTETQIKVLFDGWHGFGAHPES